MIRLVYISQAASGITDGELRARRLETVPSQTFTNLMRDFVRKLSAGT